jgi:lipopolysaccharide heptosyltransferase II
MKEFKNILIVRTDRLGDVVLTMPSIKVLRQACPRARISMLVSPVPREIIEGSPCLDEIMVDDRQNTHRGLRGFIRLIFMLRQRPFDLAVIYHTKKRTNLACFLAGIPCRIGYKNNKMGFLLTHPIRDDRPSGQRHEAQYCLDVLRYLGVGPNAILEKSSEELAGDLYVAVSKDSQEWAEAFCRKNNIRRGERLVAIHPGASDPSKRWPECHFSELINRIAGWYTAKIVLIGTSDFKDIARHIASQASVPVLDMTGQTTVGQLAGLLERCDLLVSNDSGPVHLAVGVGTPVVSIFMRNQPGINPQRWRPLGKKSRVVSVPLNTNTEISFKKAGGGGSKCLEAIPTQAVLEAVDSLFKLC